MSNLVTLLVSAAANESCTRVRVRACLDILQVARRVCKEQMRNAELLSALQSLTRAGYWRVTEQQHAVDVKHHSAAHFRLQKESR
jgi:hypothetical protein